MQSLLMAEIKWWKSDEVLTFFNIVSPQAILNTFIIVCDNLLKKNTVLHKEVFSILILRQENIWHRASSNQKFSFSNIFHRNIAISRKVSISFQKNQNEGSLPRLLSSNLLSHCRKQWNCWELCRLVRRVKLCSDEKDFSSF